LFTDIEGSTRMWEEHPDAMRSALARHDAILREVVASYDGVVVKGLGDGLLAAFATPEAAVRAALAGGGALEAESWDRDARVRARMGLHTGSVERRAGDYFGPALNRAARLTAVAHGGQIICSQVTADLVRDGLPPRVSLVDLGVHRLRDLARPEEVFQITSPDLPSEFPALRSLGVLPNNLPVQLTSFVGRDRDMADLRELLRAHRLVTLTGAAGCGKTRLALQVAADVLDGYSEGGVWLVDLAPLADPELVTQAVAVALAVRENAPAEALDLGGQTALPLVAVLVEHLRSKELLLVLDNCEHVLDAAGVLVATLLRECPGLAVLATSREALGVVGEVSWRVRSLSVPDPKRLPPLDVLADYEAIRLFIDRARARVPDFALTELDGPAVAQVCRRLDGIPLAIELAAARIDTLAAPELAARLDDRFRLLVGGSRMGLERHQTLRAAVDWSYDALSRVERQLLERLTVFAGGCTLDAVEHVCAGDEVDADGVVEVLSQLVAKSLVVMDRQPGQARYRLLEIIRQYGREKLAAAPDLVSLQVRHRDWCVDLVRRAERETWGPNQTAWFAILEAELDNLRQALDHAIGERDAEMALFMAGALGRFWMRNFRFDEGERWLLAALALDRARAFPFLHAQALNTVALIMVGNGREHDEAVACASQALAIFRELGTRRGIFWSLSTLSACANVEGDVDAATAYADEALALARSAGHDGTVAYALNQRAAAAFHRGDFPAAEAFLAEAIPIMRRSGDKRGLGQMITLRGCAVLGERNYASAAPILEEGLAIYGDLGEERSEFGILICLGGAALLTADHDTARAQFEAARLLSADWSDRYFDVLASVGLGQVALTEGDPARAAELYRRVRQLTDAQGFELPWGLAGTVLAGFAKIAAAAAAFERAARLFGAAEQFHENDPLRHIPQRWLFYEHLFAEHRDLVRNALGDSFARLVTEGSAMPRQRALAYALD
jgi:predicted ATPase/class 3 adenylate cyclase